MGVARTGSHQPEDREVWDALHNAVATDSVQRLSIVMRLDSVSVGRAWVDRNVTAANLVFGDYRESVLDIWDVFVSNTFFSSYGISSTCSMM